MYGEWLRITPAQLDEVVADPGSAYQLVEAARDGGGPAETVEDSAVNPRSGTDKTWHALVYLLERAHFPVNIITGEQRLPDDADGTEVDWGYGPPGYLTPDQVRQAATALAELTGADLTADVERADLTRNAIYPQVWDEPDSLEWAVHALPFAQAYFASAAHRGDAVMCWIG
jgi:hypothetical protein